VDTADVSTTEALVLLGIFACFMAGLVYLAREGDK